MDLLQSIALSAGLAWASGLRLYLVVFLAGMLGYFGYLHLPASLSVLQHPLVMATAGVMALAELVADKIPAFDSLWDGFQTFIRIPAGALLAAFAMGEVDPAWMLAAGLLGGTITAGTHFAKAGSRLAINASPEPFSNWLLLLARRVWCWAACGPCWRRRLFFWCCWRCSCLWPALSWSSSGASWGACCVAYNRAFRRHARLNGIIRNQHARYPTTPHQS